MAYREATVNELGSAVRAIRIATTLTERFAVLLSSPIDDDSDLMTAEAQRIYPEIWTHLDEAARTLRRSGRDVSRFDAIRAQELGALGITDIDVQTKVDFVGLGRMRIEHSKTITFNLGGYNRAHSACDALMASLPDVDWAALARAEDKEIAAAGSMHTARWKRAATIVGVGAGIAAASVGLFQLLKAAPVDDRRPAPRAPDPKEVARANEREALVRRETELANLQHRYTRTCDASLRGRLVQLLRENGQNALAGKVETEACVPLGIPCTSETKSAIATRIGAGPDLTCRGVSIAGPNGTFQPAFFVLAGARRGVFAEDGETPIVPLGPTPTTRFIGAGDLDGDGTDEIVLVGATLLVVSRVNGGAFVDIAGPALLDGCAADVAVAKDGNKPHRLVITGLSAGKGCLPPGQHAFKLAGGQLVEER